MAKCQLVDVGISITAWLPESLTALDPSRLPFTIPRVRSEHTSAGAESNLHYYFVCVCVQNPYVGLFSPRLCFYGGKHSKCNPIDLAHSDNPAKKQEVSLSKYD